MPCASEHNLSVSKTFGAVSALHIVSSRSKQEVMELKRRYEHEFIPGYHAAVVTPVVLHEPTGEWRFDVFLQRKLTEGSESCAVDLNPEKST